MYNIDPNSELGPARQDGHQSAGRRNCPERRTASSKFTRITDYTIDPDSVFGL